MLSSSPLSALPRGVPRRLKAGQSLFRAGDRAIGLIVVRTGTVELHRAGGTGRVTLMQRAGPGDTLAEASLFERTHHCDAVATTAAEVEVLSRAALDRAAVADPDLPWRLAIHLARRLVDARARAERLSLPGASERVLSALEARLPGVGGVRRVGGPWRSLAAECCLTEEATYRALARLERQGHLRRIAPDADGPGAVLDPTP